MPDAGIILFIYNLLFIASSSAIGKSNKRSSFDIATQVI